MFVRSLLCGLVLGIFAVPASATISYYSDSASFLAAITGMTETDVSFDSSSGTRDTFTLSGVTFTGIDAGFPGSGGELMIVANPGTFPAVATGNPFVYAGDVLRRTQGLSGYSAGSITISVPADVRAFSFAAGYANGSVGSGFEISLHVTTAGDSNSQTITLSTLNKPYFAGFSTDSQITGITITASNAELHDQLEISGFSYDTAPGTGAQDTTPEPASSAMTGLGLVLLVAAGRRRFKALTRGFI